MRSCSESGTPMLPEKSPPRVISGVSGAAFCIARALVFIEEPRSSPSPGTTCTDQCWSLVVSEAGIVVSPS